MKRKATHVVGVKIPIWWAFIFILNQPKKKSEIHTLQKTGFKSNQILIIENGSTHSNKNIQR